MSLKQGQEYVGKADYTSKILETSVLDNVWWWKMEAAINLGETRIIWVSGNGNEGSCIV